MLTQSTEPQRDALFPVLDAIIADGHAGQMGATAYIVYCLICRHTYPSGNAEIGFSTIAEKTGLSRRASIQAINRLVELGYIHRQAGGQNSPNTYSVLLTLPDVREVEPKIKSTKGFVYLMRNPATGEHKIGRALEVEARARAIAKELDCTIDIVAAGYSGDYIALEKQLHDRYSSQRLWGEWFDLSSEDVAELAHELNDR